MYVRRKNATLIAKNQVFASHDGVDNGDVLDRSVHIQTLSIWYLSRAYMYKHLEKFVTGIVWVRIDCICRHVLWYPIDLATSLPK
jgi:hypothetical protein